MNDIQKFKSIDIRADENLLHFGEPLVHLTVILADIAVLLIGPVCSDTFFGDVVHAFRANLDFYP